MKKVFDILFHRLVLTGLLLSVQIYLLLLLLVRFNRYFSTFYVLSVVIGFAVATMIVNNEQNPATKIAWIFFLMLLPVVGAILYLLIGQSRITRQQSKQLHKISKVYKEFMRQSPEVIHEFSMKHPQWVPLITYLNHRANSPLYDIDEATYLPSGESFLQNLLKELNEAKSFIFMQYFIIEEGEMWASIVEVLTKKAKEGVDVRILYDDLGCLFTLPQNFAKSLRSKGIKCYPFNPIIPILSIKHNHRDHRKISVIDGRVGFVGGINLADEYINVKLKHGHWKDSAVMISGAPVQSLTMIFLSTWSFVTNTPIDSIHQYVLNPSVTDKNGYTMTFSDSPFDGEAIGESVFLSIIHNAKKYVYLTSPYLIVSQELINACSIAAKSGVTVKLFLPGIPDKKTIFSISRSHYYPLIEAGVEIYEYTPGFLHAKSVVCDSEIALVGTINLDYRSLYHHFECSGVYIGHSIVLDIEHDLEDLQHSCRIMDESWAQSNPVLTKVTQQLLRVFAPLL